MGGWIPGLNWSEDPTIHGLGCGSHSCKYVKPTGMGTNGPCQCSRNKGDKVERFLLRNLASLFRENEKLKAEIEMDKILKDDQ